MINELLTQDTNMQTDRRAILTLVALGRITAAEAERLLLALNAGREGLWVLRLPRRNFHGPLCQI